MVECLRTRRRIYSPDGALFYEKIIPFSSDISEPVPYNGRHAIPHALVVQPASFDDQGSVVVSDYIAMSGTWIGDHAIVGNWRIEVYLDAATVPNVTSVGSLVR